MSENSLSPQEGDVIVLRAAKCWSDAEDILHIEFLSGVEIGAEDVHELLENSDRITKGVPSPILVDIRGVKSTSREARLAGTDKRFEQHRLASALLISSPMTRAIANIYVGINKPSAPVRMFTSEDEAIKWLKEFVE